MANKFKNSVEFANTKMLLENYRNIQIAINCRGVDETISEIQGKNTDKLLNLRYQNIYNNALCALNTKISNLNFTIPYSFTDFVIQGSSLEQGICRNNIYFHNVVAVS